MSVNSGSLIIFITMVFSIFAGVLWLQVFLSKKENKWLGLVMPLISLMISLLSLLGLVFFAPMESTIFTAFFVFFLYNIPTAILMAIYIGSRKKKKKNFDIEKMKIKDLD